MMKPRHQARPLVDNRGEIAMTSLNKIINKIYADEIEITTEAQVNIALSLFRSEEGKLVAQINFVRDGEYLEIEDAGIFFHISPDEACKIANISPDDDVWEVEELHAI
jgi:hypothetical protein